MSIIDRTFIGKGEIHLKVRGGTTALLPVGNCSELTVSFEEDSKSALDFTSPGGGEANSLTRITQFTGNIKHLDISADNLALALRGAVEQVLGGTVVTDEAQPAIGVLNELVPFEFLPDLGETLSVTDAESSAPLTAGVDYEVTRTGIKILDGTNIGATGILATYTKAKQEIMQALVAAGQEFKMVFNGLNEAQSGKAVNISIHRVKFSPAQGLSFIGDDFAEMDTGFNALSDATIAGDGVSKYMKVIQEL
jgi:hypothetical protein